jgi:selenium metabolism protein YedF
METIDMRGQPCPIPVVNAKKTLAKTGVDGVVVLVDNNVAVQNLEKMARGTGRAFSAEQESSDCYRVTITQGESSATSISATPAPAPAASASAQTGPVVLITSDTLGRGADELGHILIKGFIFSLAQLTPAPVAVIFLNGGARLTTKGAATVDDLKALQAKGTEICTCGTCANYYKLTDNLAVGRIVDMMYIAERLARASHIISI